MKKNQSLQVFVLLLLVVALTGCATGLKMKNIKTVQDQQPEKGEIQMLIKPHQTLGLEPTPAICRGDISTYSVVFPKRLLGGEYFLGTLRWNVWVIRNDGSESFGQILFSGMHPSGYYFGTAVLDGDVSDGQLVILSTDMNYIYSPFEKEIPVEREKFLTDHVYRKEKIVEANKIDDGVDFKISSLTGIKGFQEVIRSWNQIQFPEGYLISPYGFKEVALIRGQNPQSTYFQKLIGTGKFVVQVGVNPIGSAIATSAGFAMDLIRATGAPSKGRDFSSEVSRREQSFANEYLLKLAENEIKKRNSANIKLLNERSDKP
ncbi:MAG: hypothetical protein WAV31_03315 [Candidatus Moraniibacteriota bacterium]